MCRGVWESDMKWSAICFISIYLWISWYFLAQGRKIWARSDWLQASQKTALWRYEDSPVQLFEQSEINRFKGLLDKKNCKWTQWWKKQWSTTCFQFVIFYSVTSKLIASKDSWIKRIANESYDEKRNDQKHGFNLLYFYSVTSWEVLYEY